MQCFGIPIIDATIDCSSLMAVSLEHVDNERIDTVDSLVTYRPNLCLCVSVGTNSCKLNSIGLVQLFGLLIPSQNKHAITTATFVPDYGTTRCLKLCERE